MKNCTKDGLPGFMGIDGVCHTYYPGDDDEMNLARLKATRGSAEGANDRELTVRGASTSGATAMNQSQFKNRRTNE